jgi:hypothetical protein
MRRQYSTDSNNSQELTPKRTCRHNSTEEAEGSNNCESFAEEEDIDTDDISNMTDQATLKEIQTALKDIKNNQESLKKSLESRLDGVATQINESIKALRDDIYLELGRLESKVKKVEERLETIEERQPDQQYPVDSSVVVINLREDADELIETRCDELLTNGLGLRDIKPVRCIRLKTRDGKPGVVKIQLKTKEDKISVLRNKGELAKMPSYKRVYIRSAQTHEERMMRLNFKTLLGDMPNGSNYRFTGSGRLVQKEDDEGTEEQQAQQQHQVDPDPEHSQGGWQYPRGRGRRGGRGQRQQHQHQPQQHHQQQQPQHPQQQHQQQQPHHPQQQQQRNGTDRGGSD